MYHSSCCRAAAASGNRRQHEAGFLDLDMQNARLIDGHEQLNGLVKSDEHVVELRIAGRLGEFEDFAHVSVRKWAKVKGRRGFLRRNARTGEKTFPEFLISSLDNSGQIVVAKVWELA